MKVIERHIACADVCFAPDEPCICIYSCICICSYICICIYVYLCLPAENTNEHSRARRVQIQFL